jgi:crotonobetainyl-CoA:carnitine CoA-transferase CaiB-like acyl-CoA transferase
MTSKLKIIELAARLPGPLCCWELKRLGHHITKVEDKNRPDPFSLKDFSKLDPCFFHWYQQLRRDKDHLIVESMDDLRELLRASEVCLYQPGQLSFIQGPEQILQINPKLRLIQLLSNRNKTPMHDLNMQAELGFLKPKPYGPVNNEITPSFPYLPWTGIYFAQQLALNILNNMITQRPGTISSVYMQDCLEEGIKPIMDTPMALSLGQFPCYNLYHLKSHSITIALAAVEEKFWMKFSQLTQLELKAEQRFDRSGRIYRKIADYLDQASFNEIEKLASSHICFSLIN